MEDYEMSQEELEDTSTKTEVFKKAALIFSSALYGIALAFMYMALSVNISWFIPYSVFIPTLALILVVALGLYLYSGKGKKYIFSWSAISFITCILLAVFEKLAS